jgi:hypothetical protein
VDCWASCVDGCGGGQSREHYISDGIYDGETITAFGLPWCKDAPLTIGVSAAVAKILCKDHNSALSNFDSEASRLSLFLKKNILNEPLQSNSIRLNGQHLEKWTLKTMLNLGYVGALEPGVSIIPPESLVRILFSDANLAEGAGFYFISGRTSNASFQNGLAWNAIRNVGVPERPIVGMAVTFNGVHFATTVSPIPAEDPLRKMGERRGVDYGSAKIYHRPDNIKFSSRTGGEKRIELAW